MDDPMLINVFFVGAEKYYRIELDGALLEHEVRKALVNHVVQRGIRQEVCEDIFMVPPGLIPAPKNVGNTDSLYQTVTWRSPTTFDYLPSDATLRTLFPNISPHDVHFIIRGAACSVVIFRLDTRQLYLKENFNLNAYLTGLLPPNTSATNVALYKPLSPLQNSPDLQNTISIDIESLSAQTMIAELESVYPWGTKKNEIHFLLSTSTPQSRELDDHISELPLYQQRAKFFKDHPSKAPSSEGTLKNVRAAQERDDTALYYGRPNYREAPIPASLLDETLSKFRHDLTTITPSVEDILAFRKIRMIMTDIFPTEDKRREALTELLMDLNIIPEGEKLERHYIQDTQFHDDGDLRVFSGGLDFLYFIQEIRNELATGNADALVEAIHYWIEHIRVTLCTQKISNEGQSHINFPIIILLNFGGYIVVAAGTLAGTAYVEHLACVPLHAHSSNIEELQAGERLVASLRLALHSLKEHYSTLLSELDLRPQAAFPFRNFFNVDGQKFHFTYDGAIEDKKLFRAHLAKVSGKGITEISDQTKLIVKFTRRYSKAAHKIAFDNGFAPKLYAVEEIHGWFMVVMEDVSADYITYWDLKQQGGSLESVRRDVSHAVRSLNTLGFVHGDVRDVNTLVRRPEAPQNYANVLVIDWDWAGPLGETKYPHSMNPDIRRAADAVVGGTITVEHDEEMLEYL